MTFDVLMQLTVKFVFIVCFLLFLTSSDSMSILDKKYYEDGDSSRRLFIEIGNSFYHRFNNNFLNADEIMNQLINSSLNIDYATSDYFGFNFDDDYSISSTLGKNEIFKPKLKCVSFSIGIQLFYNRTKAISNIETRKRLDELRIHYDSIYNSQIQILSYEWDTITNKRVRHILGSAIYLAVDYEFYSRNKIFTSVNLNLIGIFSLVNHHYDSKEVHYGYTEFPESQKKLIIGNEIKYFPQNISMFTIGYSRLISISSNRIELKLGYQRLNSFHKLFIGVLKNF
jgi:hypothetical protein